MNFLSAGRLVTYRAKNTGTGHQETLYVYDLLGRRTSTTWPDGEQIYDALGRLTAIHHEDKSSANTLRDLNYGYDDAHRITSMDKLFYDDVQNTRITAPWFSCEIRFDGQAPRPAGNHPREPVHIRRRSCWPYQSPVSAGVVRTAIHRSPA